MSWAAKRYDVLPALSIRGRELRSSLRIVTLGWMFGSAWMVAVGTAAMLNVGYLCGFTDLHWGILSATMYASTLMQLPASWVIERTGRRKSQFLKAITVSRAMWLGVGLVPVLLLLWPGDPAVKRFMAWAVLAIIFASRLLDHIGVPAWMNWMADLIPSRIRGRIFAIRSLYSLLVQIAVTVTIGLVLDWMIPEANRELLKASAIDAADMPSLAWVLLVIFAFAAACGVVDVRLFKRIREIVRKRPPEPIGLWQVMREPMADKQFIHFAGAFATLAFGTSMSLPFFSLSAQKHLGMNNLETMLVLALCPPVGSLLTSKAWGVAIDRWGRRPIMILTLFGSVLSPWMWMLVPPGRVILAGVPMVWGGIIWQGLLMARLNMELAFADEKGRSTYSAATNVLIALSGTLGGLMGGWIAQATSGMAGRIGPFVYVNYHLMFLLSGCVRAFAAVWMLGMADPKAKPVKQVARHMAVAMFYSAPVRLLNPVRRLGRPLQRVRRINNRWKP